MGFEDDDIDEEKEFKNDKDDDLRSTMPMSERRDEGLDDDDKGEGDDMIHPTMTIGRSQRGDRCGNHRASPFPLRKELASGEESRWKDDRHKGNEDEDG